MKKTRKSGNSYLKLTSMLLFPCALFAGGTAIAKQNNTSYAEEASYSYRTGYRESANVTNPTFAQGATPYTKTVGTALANWTALVEGSKATGMIINVGDKVESNEGETETDAFTKYKKTYCLESNPMTKDKSDNRILMINSKAEASQKNIVERQGYKSTILSLEANSYYVFSVSALTMLNGDDSAACSMYISGLVDEKGEKFDLGYENVSPSQWTDYYFFIATGAEKQNITIQLYLGSKEDPSKGVAFFDGIQGYRYSENEFFDLCALHDFAGVDSDTLTDGEKIFMVNKLAKKSNSVADIASYNFDFEDTNVELEDKWTVIAHPNGTASVINYADFESETGFSPIGNNLSRNNERALVMQTNSNEYSSSYIGLKSDKIEVKPHASYKVSLNLKIADMESGSFYLKLTESDAIYSIYSDFISEDEDSSSYLKLSDGKTSGYTSNKTNNWTNDYQTVEFYVKGHALYTSYVNLELWLGDNETSTVGCVVIDDINVERVADSSVDSANCLTLTSNSDSTTIENASFDTTTSDTVSTEYPLDANGWTSEVGSSDCESGIVYLDGNTYTQFGNQSVYENMYSKEAWSGINPGKSDSSNAPCNVYMMFNNKDAYQSLQSPNFDLKDSEYYRLSFDYYNQVRTDTTPSKFKVEVIDSNGIILFSQDDIQNLDEWAKMDIYFKANKSKTHNVYVKIYFGEENSKVGGWLYLDNFNVEASTESAYNTASYKTDTTGFFTKLDLEGLDSYKILDSSAYTFSATSLNSNYSNSDVAMGGIVSGTNNVYDITNTEDNLLVIKTLASAKASLKGKCPIPVEFAANSYYKLTFSLATFFNGTPLATDEHTCNYGVSILLNGYKEVANLSTNDILKEYTIYFKTGDTSSTPTLEFILNSDCDATTGTAVLTNLAIEATDEDTYMYELTRPSYGDSVYSSEYVSPSEEPPKEENKPEETPAAADNSTAWLAASSIITALALIIAVVGLVLRSVKIKKITKIKSQVYDRRLNENHELVMAQAQKIRDKELEDLATARDTIIAEKAQLEQEHKEYIRSIREERQGKISRDVEKRFKQYTSKVASLNEKINIIKEKMDYTVSADHLIEIERKIVAKQEDAKRK